MLDTAKTFPVKPDLQERILYDLFRHHPRFRKPKDMVAQLLIIGVEQPAKSSLITGGYEV